MSSAIPVASTVTVAHTPARLNLRRVLLLAGTAVAIGLTASLGAAATEADPDLVRLLRFMAALKGAFALIALGACYWRLARPAAAWREAVYVAGPALMAAGALGLWRMQAAGLAALLLHGGMFALLAAALTDAAFIPALRPKPRTR